jgi:hypothetical protein
VLNRYKADVEFTAYYNADLCEGHEFRSRQTQEEEFFRFPSAAKIQKQIRMITSKVLSNAEFRFEGIKRDTEMTIFRSSFGVLRDVMTFLSERACTMIENVRFFGTEMNRKSTLLLMQYVDILRAPKLTGEISSRFTRVQTIKQPKAYVAFSQSPYGKDSSYSEPELEQELRPFGLSQTWAATTYISRILARKGVETPTARIVTIQAEQHPYVAEEMQSRSKRPETIKKRDKRRMEEARAAVGWVLQFPSVEQAEKAAKVIQQKMPNAGLLVTDNLHSLNNFVRYSFKDKDDKPIPLQGLPKPREDQGAQVVTEEEENPYSKKLEQAVNDFEIAIKGRPSTRKLVTPMRSEGSKERGFEVFYTYNPLLFQLTRLYLPSLRQGGEMSPWRSWLTTKAGKDGTPKIHMRYPELADSVEAIGLYGSLLALLRYGAMTFEVDAGRTPSSLSDIIEGVKLYSGEKVPESFLKMEPKGWMGADSPMMFDDWAAVYEKRLLGDETSLTQLMQRLKKAAVVGLNEAARLGTEGLYLPHHQEGVEGRAFSELTQVPKTEGKDVPALDIDETNPTTVALATYIKRTLPLIAKAASLYTTEGGKFVMGTADDALVKFWESLKSENVKIGEPDAATAKKLTPEKKLKEYRPLSVLLDPQRGNLLRILGAQPNDPRQGFSLEDVEVKLAKGVLPTVVLPWLANRLLVLHALTGKSGYAANVSPMPPLSAGAGQTIPEPEDSYLAQAQREHAKRLELLNVINNALDDR